MEKVFDFRPASIIRQLDLRRPIYQQTAAYGHFGRTDIDLPWEKLDKVDQLKKVASGKVDVADKKVEIAAPAAEKKTPRPEETN